ncbi:TerB family tellurite resistance protein [Fodinicurvata halophila]|uniref:TerB family tellurite resistance protein n=1 Tax=Fodinicurvata halophila TaxID=1419723 RepID=A0ABV8UHG3_9PROT
MSIWGKIVGGAAGFALGGPIGALLGGLAGHAVDVMNQSTQLEPPEHETDAQDGLDGDRTKNIAFTIGVIVLGAKMAKSDGKVTKDEVSAFKEVFHIPPEEMKNVGRIFDQAKRDARGFEPYARQLGKLFSREPQVLEELLNGLFHIARADGDVTPEELDFLNGVAREFGLSDNDWQRIKASNYGPDAADPYSILGISRDSSDEEIKKAYRQLVRDNHPDKLVAQGMPEEFINVANDKLARINEAYDKISRQRGLR